MKVVLYPGPDDLGQRLRLTLRLRWPDVVINTVAVAADLPGAMGQAGLVFIATPSGGSQSEVAQLLATVRSDNSTPLIVLAKNPSDEEMLDVMDAGADDYIPVTASATELVARVFALLRRVGWSGRGDDGVVEWGPLVIRRDSHEARVSGEELRLTPTEFSLLYHLTLAAGNTVKGDSLQKLIWNSEQGLYTESLRKYVQRLRRKLDEKASGTLVIIAVRGVGYRLAHPREGAVA